MICTAAVLISCVELASSSAADATSSALLAMLVLFLRSSAIPARSCAARSDMLRAVVCCWTICTVSSLPEACSSAAVAMISAPFSASWEALLASSTML
jgi:hypothetical protein